MSVKARKKILHYMNTIFGIMLSLIVLTPFAVIVVNSMKTHREANMLKLSLDGISMQQMIDNYSKVIETSNLFRGFLNSTIVTALAAMLIIITSALTAFIISRRGTRFMQIVNSFIIAGLTLPLATVPIFFMLNKIHIVNTFTGAILVYTAGNFAFAYFLYVGFFKSLSREIDEAAIIDGARPLTLFFQIIFPLLKPATVTVLITQIMSIWNDFGLSIYLLNKPSKRTAVLSTYAFVGQKASEWNLLFADVVLVSLPVVIIYLILQKYIISGITSGALKG